MGAGGLGRWIRSGIAAALAAVVLAMALPQPVAAQPADGLSALARFLPDASALRDAGNGGLSVELALTQPVPWRVRLIDGPPRLLLDFSEVDFSALRLPDPAAALGPARAVQAVRAGALQPGWSRLVLELAGPMGVDSAEMRTDTATGRAVVRLALSPVTPEAFAASAESPQAALGLDPGRQPAQQARPQAGDRRLVVVLDPGHGGIDPGAERDGLRESDLMLSFARELREALLRAGGFDVVLTRDEDVFVSLEARVRIARTAGADVFLSLHADALPDGGASGATVYILSDEATDAAAAALAERHDRADLLGGVDLRDQDDLIAEVLISIARTETAPRIDALADALVGAITAGVGRMHRRPRQAAGFSVLKAPDIPSVLLELGFMSSPRDLADLQDPEWRARMAEAIVSALQAWALEDASAAALRRR